MHGYGQKTNYPPPVLVGVIEKRPKGQSEWDTNDTETAAHLSPLSSGRYTAALSPVSPQNDFQTESWQRPSINLFQKYSGAPFWADSHHHDSQRAQFRSNSHIKGTLGAHYIPKNIFMAQFHRPTTNLYKITNPM
jgi:hypothetical protein